jgi:hypothetical protein
MHKLLDRIPYLVIGGAGKAAAVLIFVATLVLRGHGHPSADAAYIHAIMHDEPLITGWAVAVMLSGSAYGVASGSPMPFLSGNAFAGIVVFAPQLLAHQPVLEAAAGVIAAGFLGGIFVVFGEAVIGVPVIAAAVAIVGTMMLPFWLVPRARRKAKHLLGPAHDFADFSVCTVAATIGLPFSLLYLILITIPATRAWADQVADQVFDLFLDDRELRAVKAHRAAAVARS